MDMQAENHRKKNQNDIKISIERQKQCHIEASNSVTKCIEKSLFKEQFLELSCCLNASYYEDIIVERRLQALCGYPLCNKNIKVTPMQKYHISTKVNKVYDITERKSFCSNECFKKSKFFKDQLPTCPVWLLDGTKKLTVLDDENILGMPGQALELEICNLSRDENDISESLKSDNNKNMAVVGEDDHLDVIDVHKDYDDDTEDLSKQLSEMKFEQMNSKPKNYFSNFDAKNEVKIQKNIKKSKTLIDTMPEAKSTPTRKIKLIDFQPMKSLERIPNGKQSKVVPKVESIANNEVKVDNSTERHEVYEPFEVAKNIILQWMTLESVKLILPAKEFRTKIDTGKIIPPEQTSVTSCENEQAYIEMCKRLDLEDEEESEFDTQVLEQTKCSELKPLPNFDELKKEADRTLLNVKAFYSGKTEYIHPHEERENVDFCTNKGARSFKRRSKSKKPVVKKNETTPFKLDSSLNSEVQDQEIGLEPVLPAIDHHSQNFLRRRIVNKNLNIIYKDSFSDLELSTDQIRTIECLVSTFKLTAENIILKPKEWSVAAYILLMLMSRKDEEISEKLKNCGADVANFIFDHVCEEELCKFCSVLLCD